MCSFKLDLLYDVMDMKIGIISSHGGHLFKSFMLSEWWEKYDYFFVTDPVEKKIKMLGDRKVYYGHFPDNRNVLSLLKNIFLAIKIIRKEKPDLLFSAGAGISVPFLFIGKLSGIKTIFMETYLFANKKTLSGRMCHLFVDVFLVQNKKLLLSYPKAKYWGSVI